MKKIFFTSAVCLFTSAAFSQVDLGLPSATGKGGAATGILYDWECIGINPANLGWENNHRLSISTMIFGISAQSAALDYTQLKNAIMNPDEKFTAADKQNYAAAFSQAEGLNLQSNMNWFTFSFRVPKVGGFAMNLRDRTAGHIKLNKNAAEILFMGDQAPIFKDTAFWLQPNPEKTVGKVYEGSEVGYMHYRELNLSYGAKLFGIGGTKDSSKVSVYGGVGFKYLWGMGNFEMEASNGVFTGHSALSSKYGIDYGTVNNFSPDKSASTAGSGSAFDIGAGVRIGKIQIALSAVDMGKITWDKNVLVVNDTILDSTLVTQGLNSWNVTGQASQMFSADSGMMEFKPGPAYETQMLSKFRLGVGFQISKRMVAGADLVLPMSDNPSNLAGAFFAAGTEIYLADNFAFSIGFAGNSTYKFAMPFSVTFGRFFKICELRIATNDILTYLSPGAGPNLSLSLSLFRFNLDAKKK